MNLVQSLRVWWQKQTGEEETPFDGDTPAWVVSLIVHLLVLVVLGVYTLGGTEIRSILVTSVEPPEEEVELITPEQFYYSDEKTEEIGANSIAGATAALAEAPTVSDLSEVSMPEPVVQESPIVALETPTIESIGPNQSDNRVVRGTATGVGATGALGAIDRITHEILLSLEQRKTLVVWVFDQSGSLQRQRESINERFERIYHELGVIEAAGNPAFKKHEDKPLLTSVVAFGNELSLVTPKPTDKLDEIQKAVTSIKNDNSGVEKVFTAVHESAKQFRQFRVQEPRRNVMIIVFTDEAGDDQNQIEPTIDMCRKYQMPVYVVGVPAPFGRKIVDIKYIDPDPQYDQNDQWIPVHQGPESFLPERVKLFSTGKQRDEPIDSGFGPYALTRLCYETGGIYFAVHPNRNNGTKSVNRRETAALSAHLSHFFDPQTMRRYRPDYVSIDQYQKLVMANKARAALVKASEVSWAQTMDSPRLTFPKQDEAALANLLSEAQQSAAKVEPRLEELYAVLTLGEGDRPKETQPRWQAGFDLAMGRVLAVKVRTQAYNAMLAKAKQGMKFADAKNDTWELTPSDEISVGSVLEKQAEQAKKYLERCVADHPGTPWAMLAAEELETPIGWKWEESYTGVNAPRMAVGDGGNANPANDAKRKMEKPKPTRKPNL